MMMRRDKTTTSKAGKDDILLASVLYRNICTWNRQIYTPYLIAACTSSEIRIIQTEKEVTLSSGVDTGNLVP